MIWDNFPHVQLIKLSQVLQIVWQEYVKGNGRHSKHLSLLRKVFALTAFALSRIVEQTMFDNVSAAKLLRLKQHNFVNYADNVMKLPTFTDY